MAEARTPSGPKKEVRNHKSFGNTKRIDFGSVRFHRGKGQRIAFYLNLAEVIRLACCDHFRRIVWIRRIQRSSASTRRDMMNVIDNRTSIVMIVPCEYHIHPVPFAERLDVVLHIPFI